MKKHTLFLVLQFWSICLLGQVPLGISFQGVVRNSTNEIIDNEAIKIRFTITKGTSTGPEVFKEIHATTTNNNGLFSLVIGNGTIENGALNTIIWSDGPYFLKREIDIDSDENYEIVGDSEFWTVPYSFYASASDSSRIADSVVYKQEISGSNDTIFLSDGGFVKLPAGFADTDQQDLSTSRTGNTVSISIERGNSISFTDEVNDSDADSSNEIQTLSMQHDTIFLSEGSYVKLPGDTVPSESFDGQILYRNNNKWDTLERGLPGQVLITDHEGFPQWSGNTYPIVSTLSVSGITATSANISVNIPSDGGQSISSRGVVFHTSDQPTVGNSIQVSGSGTGSFTVTVNGLLPNTTYYVRGYGVNSIGTGYGNTLSFVTTMPTLPVLTTHAVSSITQNSFKSGGVITSDGGSAVIARGLVWNTSPNPTLSDDYSEDGSGLGNFISSISGLTDNTVYYVRAYATNSIGTSYGNEISVTTATLSIPMLSTISISNITSSSAFSGGIITSDGGSGITEKGLVWSTDTDPDLLDEKTNEGSGSDNFNSVLTGLSAGVTYYVRAYATNSIGTGYGEQRSFTAASTSLNIATIVLDSISEIGTITARAHSNISNQGGGEVTERGIVWHTEAVPTVNNNLLVSGSGSGVFVTDINEMPNSSTIYIRAFAVNNFGISYSNEISFTTLTGLPTLSTNTVNNIITETATSGGDIIDDGGSEVTDRGVVWSTSPNPTLSDEYSSDGTGIGYYVSRLSGLIPETTYYIRAYATNSFGTAYGNERSFTTLLDPPTITDIDGNVYRTVVIGSQTWMGENLKVSRYNDGSPIPYVVENAEWSSLSTGAWSYYNHDESYNGVYGKLYNWYAVNTGKLCPTGWHVPSDAEWTVLTDYLGGASIAGGKLKEVGTDHWNAPNTGATDEVGFTGLPGGRRSGSGSFDGVNVNGYWWSSTYTANDKAWSRGFDHFVVSVSRDYIVYQISGFSIRCLKD